MSKKSGLTLIELMIALVIVSILASVAVPIYKHYIRKGHRANAMQALHAIQLDEEKYRYSNLSYSSVLTVPTINNYTITISNVSATAYTLTATGLNDQINDSVNGTSCANLVLAVSNGNITKTPASCWTN